MAERQMKKMDALKREVFARASAEAWRKSRRKASIKT
jgi:hypothetical protein